jgi:hypothetical protein
VHDAFEHFRQRRIYMPFLQTMTNRACHIFSFENIKNLSIDNVPPGSTLSQLLQTLGIATTSQEIAAVGTIPGALQCSIMSIMNYAIDHNDPNDRIQMSFSWSPAYEWGLHVWEAHAVSGSPSAITINIEGPYPT